MKVLAIGCHPDDIEIGCSGTLVKCVKRGDEVTVCHVANGNMGHEIIKPDELRTMRAEEAQNAGKIGGINVVSLDIGDLLVNSADMAQRDKVMELIRKVQPDFIITHSPTDYMADHLEVSKLVFNAAFAASVPQYGNGVKSPVTPIYYMDTLAGLNFNPTEYVDITDEIETKIEMRHNDEIGELCDSINYITEEDDLLEVFQLVNNYLDNLLMLYMYLYRMYRQVYFCVW